MAEAVAEEPPLATELSGLKGNIFGQLRAAQDVFEIIPDLVKLAQARPEDPELGDELERIMSKLLGIGEALSDNAKRGGKLLKPAEEPPSSSLV